MMNYGNPARLRCWLGVSLMVAITGLACDGVTPARIEKWKGTEKGPTRLMATLQKSSMAPGLRASAAVALVDIGRVELVIEAALRIPASDRWDILATLIPAWDQRIRFASPVQARNARDALFGWRSFAAPEQLEAVDAVLLSAIEQDMRAEHARLGRYSTENMVLTIGAPAAPMLVRVLSDPAVPYADAARFLAIVGDEVQREQGARALVARAGRQPAVPALWNAIGRLGQKSARDFLVGRLVSARVEDAVHAARALQQGSYPEVLPLALKMSVNDTFDRALREELFRVVEATGGPEAQRGLLAVISAKVSGLSRYRACQAAFQIGRAKAILPVLIALPSDISYNKGDFLEYVVKDLVLLGPGSKEAVLSALSAESAVARMAAILALETQPMERVHDRFGSSDDVPALLRLAGDKRTVKGFPRGVTVGSEAVRVAALLRRVEGIREL